MAAGEDNLRYTKQRHGAIYASDNRGDTWRRSKKADWSMQPNGGDQRMRGERLAVDPVNADVVLYGSHDAGLWMSTDGAASWTQIPLEQVPAGLVVTETNRAGKERAVLFGVMTVASDANGPTRQGRTQVIYALVHGDGVYRTEDAGATWSRILASPHLTDLAVAADRKVWVSSQNRADRGNPESSFIASHDGHSWHISRGVDAVTIACHPNDPDHVVGLGSGGDGRTTLDGGRTWTKQGKERVARDVPWLQWTEERYMSAAQIAFNPAAKEGELWFAQGIGVWRTRDLRDDTMTWHSVSAGIEELVSQDITILPDGAAAIPVMDRQLFITRSWDEYPARHFIGNKFAGGRAVASTPAAPGVLVFAGAEDRNFTMDAGETWTPFPEGSLGTEGKFSRVAICSGSPDNFVVFINEGDASFRTTTDRGKTWARAQSPDLTSVPLGGRAKPLVADGADHGTFYFFQTNKGLLRSTDKGLTWQLVNRTELPRAQWHAALKSVPGRAGNLLLVGDDWDKPSIGLWRSRDHGVTWEKDRQVTQAIMACAGPPVPASEHPTIYLQGSVSGDFGIWRSIDDGESWQKIATHPLGILASATGMAADPTRPGVVALSLSGWGCVYGYNPVR